MKLRWVAAMGLLGGLVGLIASPARAQSYNIVNLGPTPAGGQTFSWGVNDSGQVSGWGTLPNSGSIDHALLWSNGAVRDLGTLGGAQSMARNINNLGQCVGHAQTRAGYNRAFFWDGSRMLDISGKNYSHAYGINNSGQVSLDVNGRAALWKAGKLTYLPGLIRNGGGTPWAINDNGVAAGGATDASGASQAVTWVNGQCIPLETLPNQSSGVAMGITDNNTAVGHVQVSLVEGGSSERPVVWKNGSASLLPLLSGTDRGWGYAVNGSEQAVGQMSAGSTATSSAFIWDAVNGTRALETLIPLADQYDPLRGTGWRLNSARAISNTGYITGYGRLNDFTYAYLLVPIQQ